MKIISFKTPSAAGIYRIEQVFKYLNKNKDFECVVSPYGITDEQILWADLIVIHELIDPEMIAWLWAYKVERGKKIIVDRDDMITATAYNPYSKLHNALNASIWRRELIKIADQVTVTTKTIAKEASKYNKNITILPNYLDMDMWDLPVTPNETGMIRLGWAGSVSHRDDLMTVLPTIVKILKEFKNVKFVFCGDDFPLKHLEEVDPQQVEYIVGTMDWYSWSKLEHTFSFDIGIAPLVENEFNHGKSNLKFLEYGMIKAAGIYSPPAYATTVKHGKTGLIANNSDQWYKYLKLLIVSKTTRNYIAKNAYEHIKSSYDIRKHIRKWEKLYRTTVQGGGGKAYFRSLAERRS